MDKHDSSATDETVQRPSALKAAKKIVVPDETTSLPDAQPAGLEGAKTVIRHVADSDHRKPESVGRTPAEVAKVLVGQQLNQYLLHALVGGGGMGAVFRAHDQQLDRIVALKVIPFVGNDPELQRRFRNEAQNAAKLDHPRIARIFDAGSHDDWHYIVFEYIQGTNLRDLVEHHGLLSLDDAVFFTAQVAEALDHSSERGIVHRDIKPSNVLISEDGGVKLVDMGLARSDNLDLSEDMTASGVTLGTFDYISPEQALDPRDADLRSDLYSLGCTFYFMLTGEAPYTGGTMLQKLISHGNAPLADPRVLRRDLPDEVVAVMHRMMAKDPKARYQNARDLLADLGELAFRFDLKRSQSNAPVALPSENEGLQRLQTHLPWMIAVLLVLMVGGYLELQSTATNDSFVIQGPASLVRSGGSQEASGATSTQAVNSRAVDSGASVESAGTDNGSGSSEQTANAESNPSTTASAGASAAADRMMSADNLGGSLDASVDGMAQSAAIGPRFSPRLPLPDALDGPDLMGDSDSDAYATDSVNESVGPSGNGSNTVDVGTATQSIGGADTVSPPNSKSEFVLPAPQAVRIVSPALLALSVRVDQIDRDTDGAILSSSFADAIDLAMRFGVGRVELATPEIVTGPISIPMDNMVFQSTVGRTTLRMVSTDTLAIGRSEMLYVGNNRTQFRDIDFHWELAEEQVDGGAMFVINDNRLTRFQDCTFTLVNQAIHDGVTFFEIVTDPEALPDSETLPGRLFNPNENALPLVAIQLDNVIVRGEANFIEMDYAAGLQLVWNNGLLAISGRMIETSGALRRPSLVSSPIQISLTSVTAEIPQGLIRMRLGDPGVYSVPIEREANQCVFVVDEGQPHIQILGVESISSDQPFVKLRGEANAYVGAPTLSDPMLYVSDYEGNAMMSVMSELLSDSLPWFDESRPRWSVLWSTERPRSQTFHRLTPANYRQDGAIYAGFQELDLPPL
ncbi:protein kinase [Stieleria sp. TO1_6]|uniref:serine/threonine-protein kinase n=1 Tax=Stieleria tagensis TaxID=2956795 RepID=UPI00209B1F8C|nr:serine/threonine-protein kinase [Stieleria tagensis]MCO8122475.1 protein kinase [Stieleria tagensis]